VVLPQWAQASEKRRAHIARVVALLARWAAEMGLANDEASRWSAAGLFHDALRDAPESMLRALTGERYRPAEILHGPAAAVRAEQDGERRQDVLDAVRYHTIGSAGWARTGRALYLADFLEPGRHFLVSEREFVANQVSHDFDAAFRQGVRLRIEYALSQGGELFPETVELWNAVR
jgi:2-amino-4-hydroxy-6-hydroxymethyldihydropteridine diphosphokinase